MLHDTRSNHVVHEFTLHVSRLIMPSDITPIAPVLQELRYEPLIRIRLRSVPFHHPWENADTDRRNKNTAVVANNSQAKPRNII